MADYPVDTLWEQKARPQYGGPKNEGDILKLISVQDRRTQAVHQRGAMLIFNLQILYHGKGR